MNQFLRIWEMSAKRFNEGKPKLSYFRQFPTVIESIARIMEQGAEKYGDGNWKKGGKPDSEYLDSMDRHLAKFLAGEMIDSESGQHHLGHAIWNLCALFELNYSKENKETIGQSVNHLMLSWYEELDDNDNSYYVAVCPCYEDNFEYKITQELFNNKILWYVDESPPELIPEGQGEFFSLQEAKEFCERNLKEHIESLKYEQKDNLS